MRTATLLLALFCPALCPALRAQTAPPSPKQFLGHDIGEDRYLATYEDLRRYWAALAAQSDRIVVEEIGTTSYGQPMVLAIVSAPENLRARARYREISERLARGRAADPAAGKAVVWIDGGLHATEAVAGQNILELVWRLVAQEDAETQRIRANVITLVCPVNPDGMEMVARAYRATGKVGGLPVLYQRWIGHDNNRDFYMGNAPETVAINRQLYRRWYPQILYNHHQTAPRGTVIFTPPFRDPFPYTVDPLVVRGIDLVAAHMNHRFTAEGKGGVISRSGATYSTWWNGGLRTTAYFHNMIGILTEVFGSPNPTRLAPQLERRLPTGDQPLPVAGQEWHARQTIEYLQTANFAILDLAARYREELLRNSGEMAQRSIECGSRDQGTVTPQRLEAARTARTESRGVDVFRAPELRDPRGYVLPADRGEPAVRARFVAALLQAGIEVGQATREFELDGARHPQGSYVVSCAQAYRPHVLDMFEPQWHPKDVDAKGDPIRPYDSAGWTLALQMGVPFTRVFTPVEGPFVSVDPDADPVLAGKAKLWQRHAAVGAAPARLGLFEPWGGDMATGWTEFMLRERGLVPAKVSGQRIRAGGLRAEFDTLLFCAGLPGARPEAESRSASEPRAAGDEAGPAPEARVEDAEVEKLLAALPAFEDWSVMAARRVRLTKDDAAPLREFVGAGGRIVAFGEQALRLATLFALPIAAGPLVQEAGKSRRTRPNEFYVPGSLLRIETGAGTTLPVMFRNNPVFELEDPARSGIEIVARYARTDVLASGWCLGEQHIAGKPAILRVKLGEGELLLVGPDLVYRGQGWGGWPLLGLR